MQNTDSALSAFLSLLCTVSLCLLPLAAIGGGAFFFIKRRKKTQPADPVPPAAPSYPAAPIVAPAQPAAPVPQAVPVSQPVSASAAVVDAPISQPAPAFQEAPAVSAPQAAAFHVSPSELVVLRGEAFSPSAGLINSYALLGTNLKVETPALAKKMFAVAFLALRQAGAVRLEPGKRKATLGLRDVDTLYVVPTGSPAAFPTGSLETQLLALAGETAPKKGNYVHNLVYRVLRRDDKFPWSLGLDDAKYALAQRGLLGAAQEKGFLGIKVNKLTMLPETQAAMAQADVASLQALLSQSQQFDPQVWKLLEGEITGGVKARTEASDND